MDLTARDEGRFALADWEPLVVAARNPSTSEERDEQLAEPCFVRSMTPPAWK